MKKHLFSLSMVTLFSAGALAENCYKVNIKQKIDVEKCAAVPVILTVFECGGDKVIEDKKMDAEVDCKSTPLRLKMKYNQVTLMSTTEPAKLWGGVNYRVLTTVKTGETSAAPDVSAPKVAAVSVSKKESDENAEPVEVKAPKKKSKKDKKAKAEAEKLPEKRVATSEKASRAPASSRAQAPASMKHDSLTEKQVQEHSEAVTKGAEIKDAATGEVAPAKASGRIDTTPPEKMVKEETKVEVPVPLNVKFSGFAWVETEDTKNFGYDGGSGIKNFDKTLNGAHQSFSTFMSNLQMDITKDRTNFTTVLEIGEIIAGDTATGGMQGARKNILEVRNAYLTHQLNAEWDVKAGVLPLSSDPNSFIVADHFSGGIIDYKKDNLSASLWTAKAFDNKPGVVAPASATSTYHTPDQYWGASVQPKFSEQSKLTAFLVMRSVNEDFYDTDSAAKVNGLSKYSWYGGTYDLAFNDHYSMQATGILNEGKFNGSDTAIKDSYKAHLVDAKFMAAWKEKGFDVLLEGLMTSGSSDSVDSTNGVLIGKRRGFSSPDPGSAYLFTIATSDGADDAPGTAKESVIGNLSQAEGLRIVLLKANQAFTDKLSGFVRVGKLQTTAANATTGSNSLGDELDLNLSYELSPGTTFQVDYGYFKPGAFFEKMDTAQMFTTRLKFNF